MPPTNRYFNVDDRLPKTSIVELRLAHDLDIEAFNEITEQLIDRWPVANGRHVVVDLSQSSYLGSVLLGLLINIRQRTRAGSGSMIVAAAPAKLVQVMRTANLERLIPVASSRAEALAKL